MKATKKKLLEDIDFNVPEKVYNDIDFTNTLILKEKPFIEAAYYCLSGTTPKDSVAAVTGDSMDYRRLEVVNEKYPDYPDAICFRRLNLLYKKSSAILQAHVYQLSLSKDKNAIAAAKLLIDLKKIHDDEMNKQAFSF